MAQVQRPKTPGRPPEPADRPTPTPLIGKFILVNGVSTWVDDPNAMYVRGSAEDPIVQTQQKRAQEAYQRDYNAWMTTQTYDPKDPTFRDKFVAPVLTDYVKPSTPAAPTPPTTTRPSDPDVWTRRRNQTETTNNTTRTLTDSIHRGTAQATPTPVPRYKRTRRNPKDSWTQGI
jgi:hypothetical protein